LRINVRATIAEAVGTFFLVLIGPGAAMVDAWSGGRVGVVGIALAFAFVVTAMVVTFGAASGAHINPAVTVALWSRGRIEAKAALPFVAAQCAGAIAASLALRAILGNVGHMGATLPAVSLAGAAALEFLMSFVLMMVVMAAVDGRSPAGTAALAIGMTVGFCALVGGPLTGASMNPARSLGPAVVGGVWTAHWIYWLAPIGGMLAAARFSDYLHLPSTPVT